MNKIRKCVLIYLWTTFYTWKYNFVEENLCCCGSDDCHGDMSHSFRSAKEYAITGGVERRMRCL